LALNGFANSISEAEETLLAKSSNVLLKDLTAPSLFRRSRLEVDSNFSPHTDL